MKLATPTCHASREHLDRLVAGAKAQRLIRDIAGGAPTSILDEAAALARNEAARELRARRLSDYVQERASAAATGYRPEP